MSSNCWQTRSRFHIVFTLLTLNQHQKCRRKNMIFMMSQLVWGQIRVQSATHTTCNLWCTDTHEKTNNNKWWSTECVCVCSLFCLCDSSTVDTQVKMSRDDGGRGFVQESNEESTSNISDCWCRSSLLFVEIKVAQSDTSGVRDAYICLFQQRLVWSWIYGRKKKNLFFFIYFFVTNIKIDLPNWGSLPWGILFNHLLWQSVTCLGALRTQSVSHVWNSWTHRSSLLIKANPWMRSAIFCSFSLMHSLLSSSLVHIFSLCFFFFL